MLILVPPNSTTENNEGPINIADGKETYYLIHYTLDGFKCSREETLVPRKTTYGPKVYRVTTVQQPTPHYITSMITDGYEWEVPYVDMEPLRRLNGQLTEDKILTVEVVAIERGILFDGLIVGSFVNGYMVFPSHTDDGRLIDPVSRRTLLEIEKGGKSVHRLNPRRKVTKEVKFVSDIEKIESALKEEEEAKKKRKPPPKKSKVVSKKGKEPESEEEEEKVKRTRKPPPKRGKKAVIESESSESEEETESEESTEESEEESD